MLDPDNLYHYHFLPALTGSLAYMKEQMGHSSIQVTADVYGHLIPGANVSWVDGLDSEPAQVHPQPPRNQNS